MAHLPFPSIITATCNGSLSISIFSFNDIP
jgi:hypothetical protein